MAQARTFEELMACLQAGDEQAAQEIFDRFGRRLIGLARTRLAAALRTKEDPEDVMQSVLKSFFRRQADGHYDLQNWDSLWSLLTTITLRKCGHRLRRFKTERRDVRREVTLPGAEEEAGNWQAIAREPMPSEALRLAETVEQVMRELDERGRAIFSLSLQGYDVPEISTKINRAERTVYRTLERIKDHLEEMRSLPAEGA